MPTLVTIPFSHFCEKARWALDHARIGYREEGHAPGFHRFAVRRATGRGGSVPVLVVEGEGVLADSPVIVRWADARAPSDRKLLPSDLRARDEALALERRLDVDFAPHVRRFAYFHLLPSRPATLELMRIATPRFEYAALRAGLLPLLRRLIRRAMHVDAEHAMLSRDTIRAIFEEVSRRLSDGRPYLMGDRFGAVDIAFAAFASPLLAPPEHPVRRQTNAQRPPALQTEVSALRAMPAGHFALRMYRDHRADRDDACPVATAPAP
jgi:glutathione S-transferase